jgi:phenylpropionate dioxygenase-like ring-hydroxylating dioxygenase large terminal subunit
MPATATHSTRVFRKTAETFEPGAKTLPQRYFVSPETFAEEQQNIFSTLWILVGHQNHIPEAGEYFNAEVGGESVIVVRDKHEEIHGFYNVCRHRGSRLVEQRSGRLSGGIQCPYHAWTYAFDGRLLGAPHMDDVSDFDKADYPLRRVDIGLWEGFIFVNLRDASTQRGGYSVKEWFSPLVGKFSRWNLPALRSARRIEYDVRANWKLIFQNYSECYHCAGVHPELSRISPSDSAENDLTEGPFLGGFMKINPGKSLTMSGNACALGITDSSRARDRAPAPNRAPARNRKPSEEIENDYDHDHEHEQDGKQRVFYYSIFPNMLLSLHPDYVMVHQLQPLSPERTLILCDWFFHPQASAREDFNPRDAIEFWDMVNKQDWHVCELSQQGIASRAYEPGPYSARESVPAAWDREYLRHVS